MGREVTKHTITQTELIMDYFMKHHSISQPEAADIFGCWRLGARISDIKKKGVQIKKETITKKNRYGHTCNFARYSLEESK